MRPILLSTVVIAALTTGCLNLPIPRVVPASRVEGASYDSLSKPRDKDQNPFANTRFFIDPDSNAAMQVNRLKGSRPADAKLMEKIANQPTGSWFGDWTPNIEVTLSRYVESRMRWNALSLFVLYNLPNRDCGQYSKGGAVSGDRYRRWIDAAKRGIGSARAVVVLEPDGLPLMDKCLSREDQQARVDLVRYAVETLEDSPGIAVYIDAGHDAWLDAKEMAKRLNAAGIDQASGFALNSSNYRATDGLIAYGKAISEMVGGKHFIIDTGRNGNGAPEASGEAAWCNPDGRALGIPPTTQTGEPLVDAFYWVKPPGESDGTCNGGPRAGVFWVDYALGLAKRAAY